MLDHDVGLPCILSYVIYTRTPLGYSAMLGLRTSNRCCTVQPILNQGFWAPALRRRTSLPITTRRLLYSTFPWKDAAYLSLRADYDAWCVKRLSNNRYSRFLSTEHHVELSRARRPTAVSDRLILKIVNIRIPFTSQPN